MKVEKVEGRSVSLRNTSDVTTTDMASKWVHLLRTVLMVVATSMGDTGVDLEDMVVSTHLHQNRLKILGSDSRVQNERSGEKRTKALEDLG